MLKQEVADKLTELIPKKKLGRLVEVGTGWGESSEFFSKLKPSWSIYTIDGFGLYGDGRIYPKMEHDKVLEINKKITALGNVIQILGDSSKVYWDLPIDVLFIDGAHDYIGCLKDFMHFWQYINPRGLICFDDYTQENNPANGVKSVVKNILDSDIFVRNFELIYEGYYCAILKKL